MTSRKRKRHFKDVKCVFFPDDVENSFQRVGRQPAALSSASSARSWERCGDSFADTPVIKNLKSSGRKLSAMRKLPQSPAFVHTSAGHQREDPVHIAWSSSDSEQCEDQDQDHDQHPSGPVAQQQQQQQRPRRPCRPKAPVQSYTRALRMLRSDKDEPPVIDTDSDLDDSEDDSEKDSGQQISDCDSEACDAKTKGLHLKPAHTADLEISGYVSDGENNDDNAVTPSGPGPESSPLRTGEGSRRSVSDWVRSAQAMLQTPQKPLDGQPKTPEDSAKKRRKFQSGGLAERLNRLQSRQRSAVSFWRHQSTCDTSTADRPGVLVLEVLEVREECSMTLARCERRRLLGEAPPPGDPDPDGGPRTLVLFNRETAAQLIPAAGDIVRVFPPWQSLSIEGFGCDVILNTHFSQKVDSAPEPADMLTPRCPLSAQRCRPCSLSKTFGRMDVSRSAEDDNAKQVAASGAPYSFAGSGVLSRHHLSLLEAIEGLGQAGSVGQDVEVVVQRVYSVPVPDRSPVSVLKPRLPSGPPSAPPPPPAGTGKTRLCVLIQDGFGMFSVVQLHLLPQEDDLQRYCRMWQGRTCVLRGVKVVQRVTRERRTRLFSLIDSLWPPVMPLCGNTPSMSSESRPESPAPSFCYLLSGQESSLEPAEGRPASALYLPPKKQTLRDILQRELKTCRCSFVATVVYKRIMQSSDLGQGEVWLVLTDPSLQDEQPERPCRRTVALCVNTSCVLTSSVLEVLNSPAACRMSFRDAIKEHGVLLCAEQSVVEICSADPEGSLDSSARPESLSQSLTEPRAKTLPQPVRLDPLGPEITPNSLCSLSGVIVGVDEHTAYSWPACNHCGSDNLEVSAERPENFLCVSCRSAVDKPDTRVQLEVFLSSSLSNCTLKVKLQPKTIMSVLNVEALEAGEFQGYDVENVLGKEVGPLATFVRVVTRKPALWIGLEEICL